MVSLGSDMRLSGIWETQVGDPLAHRQQGFIHCASSHAFAGLATGAVAMGEDEEVADLVFLTRDSTEGRVLPVLVAEGDPGVEDLGIGPLSLACSGFVGKRQSSAEVKVELVSGERWSSRHGLSCG